MTRRPDPSPSAAPAAGGDAPAPRPERLAELVAGGTLPFPAELPATEAAALAARVRRLRRDRLVRHVVRAIAVDLAGAAPPAEEPPC